MKKFLVLILFVASVVAFSQTVNWAFLEEPISLNIWDYLGPNSTVWTGYIMGPRTAGLYAYGDVRFDYIPSLASDLPEITQEGDLWVYTVPLRNDITWSDGTKFTAEDAAWTLNTVLQLIVDYGLGGNWAGYVDPDYFVKAEVVDDYTLKCYFTAASLAKANFGALMVPILQKKYWAPKIEEALKTGNPLQTIYNYDTSDEPLLGS